MNSPVKESTPGMDQGPLKPRGVSSDANQPVSVHGIPSNHVDEHIVYLTGARFWLIITSIVLSMFLTNLEIPIVTTSLVAITNDFGGFDSIGWVISSYLLGYVGVLVIFAKLSDIFGRKLMFVTSISIFICFSAGCGAAQSLKQLIILRAFQGVGGGGCFALTTAMLTELVPPHKYAKYTANLSIIFAVSLLCGPILGGAISSRSSWRWVFLLNVPAATPALLLAIFALPNDFPHHGKPGHSQTTWKTKFSKQSRAKVDGMGAALLLLATLSITAAFEEAGSRFPWKSAYVISLLSVSGLLWISLLTWERYVTNRNTVMEPVLPWRFFKNRAMLSLLLNAVFLGGPWFVAIFQLPQKLQFVHGSSGVRAGIQTMPFTFAAPLGSLIASIMAGKLRIPILYLVAVAGLLQTIGFALLASLPESPHVYPRAYGFQIIAGFGCGINICMLLLTVPFVIESRDKAVGMGAVSQLRVMGGAIVLSIATSVFNSRARSDILEILQASSMPFRSVESVQSLASLHISDQQRIIEIMARGYNLQMYVLCAFAALQIPTALLMWRKKQIMV